MLSLFLTQHPALAPQHLQGLEFPVAKLTDYDEKLDELLASDNAFGLIPPAFILTRQTLKENQEHYEAKLSLVRILYKRHWDKQRVIDLFTIVDWLMTLPVWLETQIWKEIEAIEESKKMQTTPHHYLPSALRHLRRANQLSEHYNALII